MYPPVFREKEKRAFNHFTVDALAELIQTPGSLVGMHPEGTRNKTDDPYTLLPAKPGVGEIVFRARPVVLPIFLLGMGNDFVHETTSTQTRSGDPVTMVIGKPTTVPIAVDATPGLKTYKRIADHLCHSLTELGEKERQYRVQNGLPNLAPETKSEPATSKSRRSAAA
jgi:1-acyl-sn-glycerol-3-phosphate acyltransferase